jgi:hypothetical protein
VRPVVDGGERGELVGVGLLGVGAKYLVGAH